MTIYGAAPACDAIVVPEEPLPFRLFDCCYAQTGSHTVAGALESNANNERPPAGMPEAFLEVKLDL